MERDPQDVIRELQEKLDTERRAFQEKLDTERRGRVAAENKIKNTAFVPFLCHCYRLLFQPVSVQKVPSLRSSGGLTKIDSRYYPRELRPWTEFPKLHSNAFGELEDLFGDQELFPSQIAIGQIQRDLSPSPLADEEDVRPFAVAAIEQRAKDVIAQYLAKKPQDTVRVIFRSNPYSLLKHNERLSRSQSRSQGRSRGQSQSRGRGRSPRATPPTSRRTSKRPATSPPPGTPHHNSPKRLSSVERRAVPDRWCIAQNAEKVRRALFTVEHKAGHKAMPNMLMTALDGRPSDLALFADAAEAARCAEEKRQLSKLGNAVSVEEEDAGETEPVAEITAEITSKGKSRSLSPSPKTARNRTAQILTQAFHYMVDNGLAYGYVSTGESLIFLYVDYVKDPSVLYYHLSVPKKEIRLPDLQEEGVGQQPIEQHSAAIARQTPIALVLTLILLALLKMPLSFEDKEKAKKLVKAFPKSYDSTVEQPGPGQVPGDAAQQEAEQGSGQSSSSIVVGTARPPQQSYCTQKCLRGLRFGLPLDQACSNVALHRCSGGADSHSVTHTELLVAVEEQLARNLDDGCAALDGHGKFGAIGALFKVTVFPHGYTFVAKGVQDDDRECLDWEERVYQRLAGLQGSLVPVCLGLVDLRRAYVLMGGARVSRLMLLSYAGERARPEQVDEEVEMGLSDILQAHGVEHGDLRLANVLWSEEQRRLMVVDFDQATLRAKRKRSAEMGMEQRQDKKPSIVSMVQN